jgi:hypothetical protein
MNNLDVSFLVLLPNFGIQNAKNLAQKFARKIIGNAMTCVFRSSNLVMDVVCQSLPLNAMVLVFLETSPVITLAMMTTIRSIVMGNVFILRRKKNWS